MKISVPYIMALGTLLLAGCGNKSGANVKDLSDATNAYLAKKGQLCLGISTKWPVDLQDSDQRASNVKASEMAALEKVGLVRSQNAEAEYTTFLWFDRIRGGSAPHNMAPNAWDSFGLCSALTNMISGRYWY